MKSGKGNTRNKQNVLTLWVLPLQLAPHQLSFHSEFSRKSDLDEALGWESWLRQGFLTIHKQRNHPETLFKFGFNWRPGEELPGVNAAGPGCRPRAKEPPWKSGCGDRVPPRAQSAQDADSQPGQPHGHSLQQLQLQLRTSLEALASSRSTLLPDSHSVFFWVAGQSGTRLLLFIGLL